MNVVKNFYSQLCLFVKRECKYKHIKHVYFIFRVYLHFCQVQKGAYRNCWMVVGVRCGDYANV